MRLLGCPQKLNGHICVITDLVLLSWYCINTNLSAFTA